METNSKQIRFVDFSSETWQARQKNKKRSHDQNRTIQNEKDDE